MGSGSQKIHPLEGKQRLLRAYLYHPPKSRGGICGHLGFADFMRLSCKISPTRSYGGSKPPSTFNAALNERI
jgi:hypothetical protein